MTTKKEKKVTSFEMTIEKELHEAWKSKRMTSDVDELVEITGKSKQLIYTALQFGHIKNKDVADTITKFYIDRSNKQKEQAKLISGKTEEDEQ